MLIRKIQTLERASIWSVKKRKMILVGHLRGQAGWAYRRSRRRSIGESVKTGSVIDRIAKANRHWYRREENVHVHANRTLFASRPSRYKIRIKLTLIVSTADTVADSCSQKCAGLGCAAILHKGVKFLCLGVKFLCLL